jgi:hypothetical protein
MKTLVQQLENESLLLLYIAGELPTRDRAELDALLESDRGLRDQLATLQSAQAASFDALAALDAAEHLRRPDSALRGLDRSMRQWHVARLSVPAKPTLAPIRMPVWAWSAGSAVAALLAFCIWWGLRADTNLATTQPVPSHGQYAHDQLNDPRPNATRLPDDTLATGPTVDHSNVDHPDVGRSGLDQAIGTGSVAATPDIETPDAETPDAETPDAGSRAPSPTPVQIVSMDSDRLGDLERRVSEDLQ